MNNSSKTGKIMIVVGIILTIAFIVYLIIAALKVKNIPPDEQKGFVQTTLGKFIPFKPNSKPGDVLVIPDQSTTPITITEVNPLVQLTDFPVTNYKLINGKTELDPYSILTIDKDLGYIFQISSDSDPIRTQLSTTVIDKTGDAAFGINKEVFARYYDTGSFKYEAFFGQLIDSVSKVKCPFTFTAQTPGTTNRDIEQIQHYLSTYLNNPALSYEPGVYDQKTKSLIQEFQKSQKITPDGSLGPKTIEVLTTVCADQEKAAKIAELDSNKKPRYTLDGRPQTGETHAIITSPSGKNLFYIKTTLAGIRGYIRDLTQTSTDKELYFLPFVEWQFLWPNEDVIVLTTKPSAFIKGYVYYLNTTTGVLTKIVDDLSGLTVNVSSGLSKLLVGRTISGSYGLSLYTLNADKKPTTEEVQFKTFPEKCTFNQTSTKVFCMVPESIQTGAYPDAWYQSLISFTDELWEIDLDPSRYKVISRFSRNKEPHNFDATHLSVDAKDKYLYFIDDRTGFLWRYNLSV